MAITWNLVSRIPEIIAALPEDIGPALEEGANAIAADAQQRVPVDTGRLRDAIHVEKGEGDLTYAVVAGDDAVFYGHIVEHGGVNTPARPFLVPAAEARKADIEAAVIDAMEEV